MVHRSMPEPAVMEPAMKIGQLYHETGQCLAERGIAEPELEAALLLGHVLRCSRAQIFLNAGQDVSARQAASLAVLIARRLRREPAAYILGEQEFWSLSFCVSPDVLIPRPESEDLLEKAFALIRERGLPQGPLLDLGVGSGALTVVLARELPDRCVVGVDRSWGALRVAAENIRRHGVQDRCLLLNCDWLSGVKTKRTFALVVSNPPYIASPLMETLQPEVKNFEPHLALMSGSDGLAAVRVLAGQVHEVMQPGGHFFMEIGWDQEDAVLEIFSAIPAYENLRVHADLAGHPRILEARCF